MFAHVSSVIVCVTLPADAHFLVKGEFVWKTLVITLVSCLPLYILKFVRTRYAPPIYTKLQE